QGWRQLARLEALALLAEQASLELLEFLFEQGKLRRLLFGVFLPTAIVVVGGRSQRLALITLRSVCRSPVRVARLFSASTPPAGARSGHRSRRAAASAGRWLHAKGPA